MAERWNIQIKIQQVTSEPSEKSPGNSRRIGVNEALTGEKRVIADVLSVAVTASSEAEAYEKAHRMLVANNPDTVVVRPGEEYPTGLAVLPKYIRDNPQA